MGFFLKFYSSNSSFILYQVENAGNKVEGYLDHQHKLSVQQSQDEMTFLKDLAAQNEKLSAQMNIPTSGGPLPKRTVVPH